MALAKTASVSFYVGNESFKYRVHIATININQLLGNNLTRHVIYRFYLLSTKEVVAKMGLAQISYSYEYLGVYTGQFVRTELADECFLILTQVTYLYVLLKVSTINSENVLENDEVLFQSLHLGLVGNPFGPAGTGKTESVKALGGLVGRLVLIFNCDEVINCSYSKLYSFLLYYTTSSPDYE